MKKVKAIVFGIFVWAAGLSQQDAQFSQYMFNHLALNPAYAGTKEVLDVLLVARNQWTGFNEGAPRTQQLVIQGPVGKKKIGLGLQIGSETIGPKRISGGALSYSYRIKAGSGKLAFGLRTGLYSYVYDWGLIKMRDRNDPYYKPEQNQWTVFSADFGMYYYTKTFYAGFAMTHLNYPTIYSIHESFGEGSLVPHIFIPAGYAWQVNENLVINPSILVKAAEGAHVSTDINCNFQIDGKFWIGAGVRSGYGISFLAMWNIRENFRIGYSYDYGLNRIGTAGRGSHEVVLGYGLPVFKTPSITPRYL
jgi:type IX secretion system PorP/SprF family membrane protein